MNRLDRAVIAGLVLVVILAAVAIGGPAFAPRDPGPARTGPPSTVPSAPYREGVLGRPSNVNPLAAWTQADRDLVALVFPGLVGRDAQARPVPALARSWTSSDDGSSWTFTLDRTARWQDGEALTADDVIFTIETLKSPDYHGPGAGSWTGITVRAVDASTVRFELTTPLGGFLELATQPIAPAHLLAGTPPGSLADDPFGEAPIGSGPYTIVELDRDHAALERSSLVAAPGSDVASPSVGSSSDPLATVRPTPGPTSNQAVIPRLEFRYFDDAEPLGAAFRAGDLDAVSGLDPAAAAELADAAGARTVRNPSTTLTAIILNLRPAQPAFADPRTRAALLGAIDRERIVAVAYGGLAMRADGLVPASSWAFDAAAGPRVTRDLKAATKALTDAGWTKAKDGWRRTATDKQPQTLELLVADRALNPVHFAIASQAAADWKALGFSVDVVERDPAVLATDHLRTGDFELALVEIAIGHDPDLYPLLASSQTRTGGANVIGLQDPALDELLLAARAPGTEAARIAAYVALQARLAGGVYLLPIAWPDEAVVVTDRVVGPAPRPVADGSERFGDVLTWRLADDR
ncbi:MAG TPA: peptide ABC transporter substrate-binding protein [Patescibacteria group bacterium]|nr:peptide ABC transporter substrate-binding protein [Patescibacteria group bacterium]